MEDELITIIYKGDLGEFIISTKNKKLEDAYLGADALFNERVDKFFKDLTRRVTNPAYLEMLLCDLYGVMTLYDYLSMYDLDYE